MTERLGIDCRAKKTILHLIDTTGPGGAETVFIQLADLMRNRDYCSLVVIRGPGWVQDELIRRGIEPIILDAQGSLNVKFLLALVCLIRKGRVSLIHSHLLGSNVYASMAGLITRVPVVATYHGMVDVSPSERFRRLKHLVMRWGIGRYVAVSQRLMANICDQGLLNPDKTTVIYNGIDTSKYGLSSSGELRRCLGLAEGAVLVGSLGNVRRAKAYDVLVKTCAKLTPDHPNVHFVIGGHKDVRLMSELEALIVELDVEDRVHFLGFQQDCAMFLAEIDIFLLSSLSEGFSISTIEAMASTLPVLVTRCGGPEEIVSHTVTGWMVEPADPEALAGGLRLLLGDKVVRERLATAGKEHVDLSFGIDRMLDGYSEVYHSLIEGESV